MLNNTNIDREKVLNKLEKLQVNKASGVDGIVPELLVKISVSLSVSLSIIFNNSFNTGIVPDDWKKANVSVIYNKKKIEKIQVTISLLVLPLRFVKSLSLC